MRGKGVSFPGQLLCPTMLFPLLCWAEMCLLMLCGGCQLEEPTMGEWGALSLHEVNWGEAPASLGKQRDPDAILTEKYSSVTGTVASSLGAGQQQNRERQVREGRVCVCTPAVDSARIFPFFVRVAKLLSTRVGAGLHFQCTCLGGARCCWERLGQGDIPLQPLACLPAVGWTGLLCLPRTLQVAARWERGCPQE